MITPKMLMALGWLYNYVGWPLTWEWEQRTHHKVNQALWDQKLIEPYGVDCVALTAAGYVACVAAETAARHLYWQPYKGLRMHRHV